MRNMQTWWPLAVVALAAFLAGLWVASPRQAEAEGVVAANSNARWAVSAGGEQVVLLDTWTGKTWLHQSQVDNDWRPLRRKSDK